MVLRIRPLSVRELMDKRPFQLVCSLVFLLTAISSPGLNYAASLPDLRSVVKIEKVAVSDAVVPGGRASLEIHARVSPGWHINSDKPLDEDFIPTELKLSLPQGLEVTQLKYPQASIIRPSFSDRPLSVFDGALTFKAEVRATKDFHGPEVGFPVVVVLKYQACNDLECLRPTVLQVTLPALREANSEKTQRMATASVLHDSSSGLGQFGGWGNLSALFAQKSYVLGFLLVFLGGLALNLTPCVYPLIGVTLAYFGSQSENSSKRMVCLAGSFVLGLAITFSALGVIAAVSGQMFGALMGSPYVLLGIAALLLILAASNFGLLTLRVPQWMGKLAGKARPGCLGALLMGAGMGIVAAPCIGPFVLGLLLMVQRSGNVVFGFALFFTLALGLGLPYFVLALAAGSIRRLPRSGEWLTWMEHLFGFILIGLALYFLDPLTPNRLMTRVLPYYAAGVAIFLGFFSPLGKDSPSFLTLKRILGVLGLVGLAFTLSLPGHRQALQFRPFDPVVLKAALDSHKPVLVDFSADWCIPCREMEATTFVDPGVIEAAQRFERLKADLTRESDSNGKLIKRYDVRGVPTLLILDSRGQVVDKLVGYVGPRQMREILQRVN